MDIEEAPVALAETIPGVVGILGDQSDEETWSTVGTHFDFIIDDGSHIPTHQIKSMSDNFWRLRSGGFWIIEDTHCMFHTLFNLTKSRFLYEWLGKLCLDQQMNGSEAGNFFKAVKTLENENSLEGMIYGIRSYKSLMVFERA